MNWLTKTATSTIGRKFFAGLSGLALVGFLIMHLAGNLSLFVGSESVNHYAELLHVKIPFFLAVEFSLLGIFLVHMIFVMSAVLRNRAARQQRYAVGASKRGGGPSALASRMMALTGITLIVFIVVHVAQLRLRLFGPSEAEQEIGFLLIDTLSQPGWAAMYIAGSLLAGWHVFHGFQSAFRSVGLGHQKYMPTIMKLGMVLGVSLGLAFAALPILTFAGFIDGERTVLAPLFEWIHPMPHEPGSH